MKKQLPKVIETGYYHPSNTNWSYHIFLIVDETGARFYKATFGGESRIKVPTEKLHAGKGAGTEYKARDVKEMYDIETYTGINWTGK